MTSSVFSLFKSLRPHYSNAYTQKAECSPIRRLIRKVGFQVHNTSRLQHLTYVRPHAFSWYIQMIFEQIQLFLTNGRQQIRLLNMVTVFMSLKNLTTEFTKKYPFAATATEYNCGSSQIQVLEIRCVCHWLLTRPSTV